MDRFVGSRRPRRKSSTALIGSHVIALTNETGSCRHTGGGGDLAFEPMHRLKIRQENRLCWATRAHSDSAKPTRDALVAKL